MRLHENFEWDEAKADSNLEKHGVSFDDAAKVLGDEKGDVLLVEEIDEPHSLYEDRFRTIGSHPRDRSTVLVIVWTDRSTEKKRLTRIVTARGATKKEKKDYEDAIAKS